MSRKTSVFALIVLTIALILIPSVQAENLIVVDIDKPLDEPMVAGSTDDMILAFNIGEKEFSFRAEIMVTCTDSNYPLGHEEVMIGPVYLNDQLLTCIENVDVPGLFEIAKTSLTFESEAMFLTITVSTRIDLMPGSYKFDVELWADVYVEPKPPSPIAPARNILPVADAGPDQTVDVYQIVEFSGADSMDPDGYLTSWTWNFGDGAEASGVDVSHTYSEPGNYTVTLTVVDVRGGEDTDTCVITVRETPPLPPPPPPLPPFLDNLTVTPTEIELGDNVTISVDIMNPNDIAISYAVDMHIENVNDPPPTWPPMDVYLRIWVDLGAYESKTVSHTMTMDTVGDFNVTVHGMTASFKVGTWPPPTPPRPAEFELSDLIISPEEVEPGDEVTISVLVTNIGEETGDYTITLDLPAGPYLRLQETVSLEGGESERVEFEVSRDIDGTYAVTVDGLTGSFEVKAPLEPEPPEPAEFVFSNLEMTPDEDLTITISVDAANDGEETGNYTVKLKLDGVVIDSEEVTLEGGDSITTSFEVTRDEGTYEVEVEGLTGTFTIDLDEEPPFWTSPGYVAGVVIIVTSAGAVIYYLWKGKHLSTLFSNPT